MAVSFIYLQGITSCAYEGQAVRITMDCTIQLGALLSAIILLPMTVPYGMEDNNDNLPEHIGDRLSEELSSATYNLPSKQDEVPNESNVRHQRLKVQVPLFIRFSRKV